LNQTKDNFIFSLKLHKKEAKAHFLMAQIEKEIGGASNHAVFAAY
jgi:hypothetical protein